MIFPDTELPGPSAREEMKDVGGRGQLRDVPAADTAGAAQAGAGLVGGLEGAVSALREAALGFAGTQESGGGGVNVGVRRK